MTEVDLVWMDPPGCYQCVQMPRLCVWPLELADEAGIDQLVRDTAGLPDNSKDVQANGEVVDWTIGEIRDPLVRITFEGFDLADEQVIRWSEVPDYIKWCWEQAMKQKP